MTEVVDVRDDQRIQRDVLAQLAWDAQLQPNEIGVRVDQGVVTLTGFVDGAARSWAATRCAQRVRGVRAVADESSGWPGPPPGCGRSTTNSWWAVERPPCPVYP